MHFRFIFLPSIVLFCFACGDLQPRDATVVVPQLDQSVPADGAKPSAVPRATKTLPTCAKGETRFALKENSKLTWIVVKEGDVPVIGRHGVSGEVALQSGKALADANASMSLKFSTEDAYTDNQLRDDRLRSYIFALVPAKKPSFQLTSLTAPENATLPEEGKTLELTLTGSLSVAGIRSTVDIPVLLTGTATGFRVTEGLEGIKLDLDTQLGLSVPVEKLLALVSAKIDQSLRLRFDLEAIPSCQP